MHLFLKTLGQVTGIGLLLMMLATPQAPHAEPDKPALHLDAVIQAGLQQPLFLTHAGDGSRRLFVLEQPGRIRILLQQQLLPRPFLDITERVRAGGERGLLGLAFHPNYPDNGRLFVNYTRQPDGATVVAEYRTSADPDQAAMEERVLLTVPQPYGNHNGGMLAFGPDGHLYIALGDGGLAGDPLNRAQNRNELLGKILRIDVNQGSPYAIPDDNPFARNGGRPEIYALGLRNPWRFSFDRGTGELWAADVGQNRWEEINVIRRGGNYGWRIMEGNHCFMPPIVCSTEGLERPVAEYRNTGHHCSVTGGYVYRGDQIPALVGSYVVGDYCSGDVMRLQQHQVQVLLETELGISSFGEDEAGEIYVIDHAGGVYRLAPNG
ncbi:MAG: PQQ-dependent sugar dehydrogenase [Gammaproteobacteria bacterium]